LRLPSSKISCALICIFLCLPVACSSGTPSVGASANAAPAFPATGQATTATTYAYPLKISKSSRYLVDQNNKPFRIQGDSAQSLIANLTYPEAQIFFADRQAKGFNTININLLERKFAVHAPANRNGAPPFTSPGDFSKPNEAYFSFADSIIDLAASKGMLISFAAMYLGYSGGDEGWWSELTNSVNTQSVCYSFGLYVGNRYKNRKNIFWVIGGDFMPPRGSEGEARLLKFMEGVKAAGATQLWSGDWEPNTIATDEPSFAPFMDLNAVYSYGLKGKFGATYVESRNAFDYSPPRPAYLKETRYENEHGPDGEPAAVRNAQYRAIFGGSTAGAFFGHRDIWEFSTDKWWSGFDFGHAPWQKALNSPGTYDMVRLGQLLDALPWFDLVPSGSAGSKDFIVQGGGNYGDADYIAAAAASDGKLLLAYIPPTVRGSVTISIDLARLSGSAHARWFDPASGKYTEISQNSLPNRGAMRFMTPGKNSAGATDWVFVLQVAPDPKSNHPAK